METVLYAVFQAGAEIDGLLLKLAENGYNGTYVPASSIHSLTSSEEEDEPSVISLSHLMQGKRTVNPCFFLVLKEGQETKAKAIIREYTASFKKIKGAIFGWPLSFFEGSF
ncbi:MAG: hypothetical protein LKJ88_02180 [Bacilli bacterium]|jgi:hypothetical protein|nr:hypothetical protein [Bacilli bacterium]